MEETIKLRSGAGRAPVEIDPQWLPMERFGGVHDAPNARALLLKGPGGDFLLLSLEMTSLMGKDLDLFRAAAAESAGIPAERVWVSVTHTFAVPHFIGGPNLARATEQELARDQAYKQAFLTAARTAARTAAQTLVPAKLTLGSGASAVNANRDIETPQGWWIGIQPNGICDRTVNVLRIDSAEGTPIAAVYNYGMQSSVLDNVFDTDGTRLITADLIGETSRRLEAERGGVAIFLPGASGDQCPRERARYDRVAADGTIETVDLGQEQGFAIIGRLAAELAEDTARALDRAALPLEADTITVERHTFDCPKQVKQFEGFPVPTIGYTAIPDGTLETSVEILRIGTQFAAVGVLPELNCITGQTIRHESPVPVTWVAQMVNGGQKYMVDAASFDRGTYGAMNGFVDRGAAEELVRQVRSFW